MSKLGVALALALAMGCGTGCSSLGHVTLKVSNAELQDRLDKKFPITKRKGVFKVVLSDPQLVLVRQNNRLRTTVTARASALGATVGQSKVTISGGVRYDKASKAFYMTDPRVTKLDVSHIPQRYQDQFRRVVDVAVQELVPGIPVYRLDKNTFKHSTSRAFLKRAWIEDQHLHLEMGL